MTVIMLFVSYCCILTSMIHFTFLLCNPFPLLAALKPFPDLGGGGGLVDRQVPGIFGARDEPAFGRVEAFFGHLEDGSREIRWVSWVRYYKIAKIGLRWLRWAKKC